MTSKKIVTKVTNEQMIPIDIFCIDLLLDCQLLRTRLSLNATQCNQLFGRLMHAWFCSKINLSIISIDISNLRLCFNDLLRELPVGIKVSMQKQPQFTAIWKRKRRLFWI